MRSSSIEYIPLIPVKLKVENNLVLELVVSCVFKRVLNIVCSILFAKELKTKACDKAIAGTSFDMDGRKVITSLCRKEFIILIMPELSKSLIGV